MGSLPRPAAVPPPQPLDLTPSGPGMMETDDQAPAARAGGLHNDPPKPPTNMGANDKKRRRSPEARRRQKKARALRQKCPTERRYTRPTPDQTRERARRDAVLLKERAAKWLRMMVGGLSKTQLEQLVCKLAVETNLMDLALDLGAALPTEPMQVERTTEKPASKLQWRRWLV